MQTPYAGSNITGVDGLIAVDKVGNKIRFYDPSSLREIKAFDAPEPSAHELAIAHDRSIACVPLYGDGIYGGNKNPNNKIMVVDLRRQELADLFALDGMAAPHGMAMTAQGKLWVVADIPNKLIRIDPRTRSVEAVHDCPGYGAHQLALTPDETKLYVSSKEGDLGVFDLALDKFVGAIPMRAPGVTTGNGAGSEGVMPTPDGGRLVVIDNAANDLRVIDSATDREVDRVPLIMNAFSNVRRSRLAKLMFSPDARHLVVTSYASGNAWVVDAADYRSQTLVPLAKGPQGMTFDAESKSVLIASHDSGLLTRIDLASRRAVAAYDGGVGIEVLAYY